ncbi:hypothetical protein BDY21DRAFT_357834 [Lineolata rhizophorae]|uniref:Uncharacterized protein n=1 Tax=Lineolata rhizophorae TaxID=578093 RepID=A0A6A6NN52_9PEZI|nr:hypothetical protein BDY21DRAFT_357834 [Lineolata rhizophorae]
MDQRNCRMLKALDHNNHARTWNAMVRLPETALAPLRNLSTNEPIPGFPQKPDRIGSMSNAAIDLVMRALELSTDHPVAVKRRLLKSYIGLFDPSVPVPSIE